MNNKQPLPIAYGLFPFILGIIFLMILAGNIGEPHGIVVGVVALSTAMLAVLMFSLYSNLVDQIRDLKKRLGGEEQEREQEAASKKSVHV